MVKKDIIEKKKHPNSKVYEMTRGDVYCRYVGLNKNGGERDHNLSGCSYPINIQSSSPRRSIQRKRTTTHLTGQSRPHQLQSQQQLIQIYSIPKTWLYSSYWESHVHKSGSDVKPYFRSKLFNKEVAFGRNRMLRGLVNSVVMTTLIGVQGEEERRLNLLSRIRLFMKLAAVVLILSIGQKNQNEIS